MHYLTRPAHKTAYNTPNQLLFLCFLSDGEDHSRRDASIALSISEKTLGDDVIAPLRDSGRIVRCGCNGKEKPYHITLRGVHDAADDLHIVIPAYEEWSHWAGDAIRDAISEYQVRNSPLDEEINNYITLSRKLHAGQFSDRGQLLDKINESEKRLCSIDEYETMLGLYGRPVEWQGRRRQLVKGTSIGRLIRTNPTRVAKRKHSDLLYDILRNPDAYIKHTLSFYKHSRDKLQKMSPPEWRHLFEDS